MSAVEDLPAKGIAALLAAIVKTTAGALGAWLRRRIGPKVVDTVHTACLEQSTKVKGNNATVIQIQGDRNRT